MITVCRHDCANLLGLEETTMASRHEFLGDFIEIHKIYERSGIRKVKNIKTVLKSGGMIN